MDKVKTHQILAKEHFAIYQQNVSNQFRKKHLDLARKHYFISERFTKYPNMVEQNRTFSNELINLSRHMLPNCDKLFEANKEEKEADNAVKDDKITTPNHREKLMKLLGEKMETNKKTLIIESYQKYRDAEIVHRRIHRKMKRFLKRADTTNSENYIKYLRKMVAHGHAADFNNIAKHAYARIHPEASALGRKADAASKRAHRESYY